jgi:sarcosine oxidase, subunit alpha
VEQDHQFGGDAAWRGTTIDGVPASTWITRALEQLRQFPDVQLLCRTTATGYYDHDVVTLFERTEEQAREGNARERYWLVRARRTVLATGTIEQPLIFCNNDRPGIMLAGAVCEYLLRYGVAVGRRVLLAGNNDSIYSLAVALRDAGVAIAGLADSRRQVPESLRAQMQSVGIEILPGCIPVDTAGAGGLTKVTLGQLSVDGLRVESTQIIPCDSLAVSGGFSPSLQLYAQAGGKLAFDEASGALRPTSPHPSITIVGSATAQSRVGPRISPAGAPNRKWVDLLHDVTVADLELALRENFTSIEHVKRYTTVGMAADQGKTSAASTVELVSKLRGIAPGASGHTTLRPPFVPVTLGAIVGRNIDELFAPYRLSPLHDWHVTQGAVMHEFGEWLRPVAYPHAGESREQATRREASGVRTAAGLFDGSSLGKIEIRGPDAIEFLDRFYINDLTTLKPFRARYGLMLRESGVIFDDGTVVMLPPDRVLITTTSGNAGRVLQWLEEWHQCEWPHMRVVITPVTEVWATVSLAGPDARAILSKLETDIDLSASAFPHLAVREGKLIGMPTRIYRMSFTGELTYEINVPSDRGVEVWEALMRAGAKQPFGMDALLLMRLEKGFLHVGSDTDGTTVPDDVGWGRVATSKQRDYIGKRSLRLPASLKSDRLQLVGLSTDEVGTLAVGNHVRTRDSTQATDGWITSAGRTVLTHAPIALAMLRGGRARIGDHVNVYDAGREVGRARVVSPPFLDAAGERMNG